MLHLHRHEPNEEERLQASSGLSVGALMTSAPVLESAATCADAAHQLGHCSQQAFPVVGHDGRAIGLLTTKALTSALHSSYAMLVREVADGDPDLRVLASLDASELLDSLAFLRRHHAVVVDGAGRPAGVVAQADVVSAMRAQEFKPSVSDDGQLIS